MRFKTVEKVQQGENTYKPFQGNLASTPKLLQLGMQLMHTKKKVSGKIVRKYEI